MFMARLYNNYISTSRKNHDVVNECRDAIRSMSILRRSLVY